MFYFMLLLGVSICVINCFEQCKFIYILELKKSFEIIRLCIEKILYSQFYIGSRKYKQETSKDIMKINDNR